MTAVAVTPCSPLTATPRMLTAMSLWALDSAVEFRASMRMSACLLASAADRVPTWDELSASRIRRRAVAAIDSALKS